MEKVKALLPRREKPTNTSYQVHNKFRTWKYQVLQKKGVKYKAEHRTRSLYKKQQTPGPLPSQTTHPPPNPQSTGDLWVTIHRRLEGVGRGDSAWGDWKKEIK